MGRGDLAHTPGQVGSVARDEGARLATEGQGAPEDRLMCDRTTVLGDDDGVRIVDAVLAPSETAALAGRSRLIRREDHGYGRTGCSIPGRAVFSRRPAFR